ncbi:hypothetical protein OH492_07590 [Vibrio chagasii]|nr:hypothetical protein [Vibrio chagasii]
MFYAKKTYNPPSSFYFAGGGACYLFLKNSVKWRSCKAGSVAVKVAAAAKRRNKEKKLRYDYGQRSKRSSSQQQRQKKKCWRRCGSVLAAFAGVALRYGGALKRRQRFLV